MLNAKFVEINSYTNEITTKSSRSKKDQPNITTETKEKQKK
jgi:hypothetical protein